jgi:hypothetical protein
LAAGALTTDDAAMSPSEFSQRRLCLHMPSRRATNTVSDWRTGRHDTALNAGDELLWSGPGPAATDDDEGD